MHAGIRLALVAGFLATAPVISASAQDSRSNMKWDDVVAAAKKEGRVVVYNAGQTIGLFNEVAKSFEAKYGIKVEQITARGSEMTERIRTEHAAGRYLGDLQLHAGSVVETVLDQVQAPGNLPNLKNLRKDVSTNPLLVPAYIQPTGILINTNLVKPQDEPKSWRDLLDPKWKGRILADDPRPIGGGNNWFTVMYKAFGPQFHDSFKAQNPVFSRNPSDDARRIARGEYLVYTPQVFALARELQGLPVKLLVPQEGIPYGLFVNAVQKNAPRPNAADVFLNHFLELDSQVIYANGWMIPVVDGAVEKADAQAKQFAGAKLLGTPIVQERAIMAERAKQIYD